MDRGSLCHRVFVVTRRLRGVLQERISPLAAAGADRLARLRELAEQDGEGSDFCLDRVKQLENLLCPPKPWRRLGRRRLRTVVPVFSALLGPKGKK